MHFSDTNVLTYIQECEGQKKLIVPSIVAKCYSSSDQQLELEVPLGAQPLSVVYPDVDAGVFVNTDVVSLANIVKENSGSDEDSLKIIEFGKNFSPYKCHLHREVDEEVFLIYSVYFFAFYGH